MPKAKPYKHIFFDLDHTLWDYDTNAEETLSELFLAFKLKELGVPSFRTFYDSYLGHNAFCWAEYRNGKIDVHEVRVNRFIYSLGDFEINKKDIAYQIADEFVAQCPQKINLMPYAIELLEHLHPRYPMHLITNGFHEVQYKKLKNTALGKYFREVVTADVAGALKPSGKIFDYAVEAVSSEPHETVYIGDNLEVDMIGARKAGMDQIFFNPKKKKHQEPLTHEVECLSHLIDYFS